MLTPVTTPLTSTIAVPVAVIPPKVKTTFEAVAVAAAEIVMLLLFTIVLIVAPAGTPVPRTLIPTARLVVEASPLIVVDAFVVLPALVELGNVGTENVTLGADA